jgi:hypothetical protein
MALPIPARSEPWLTPTQVKARGKIKLPSGVFLKPLLIGTEGMSDMGKTRWALTAPGNIMALMIDRNYESVFESPGLEGTNPNIRIKTFSPPAAGTVALGSGYRPGSETDYTRYYALIRDSLYVALEDPKATVVLVDGDSDYWDLHILAHFGKNTQIFPQTRYAAPKAEKRAQIAKCRDSGKIIISTNKVADQYRTVYNADGSAKKDPITGEDVREKTGEKERQGFKDQDYLWDLQLRHMFMGPREVKGRNGTTMAPAMWGIKILKCKPNMDLVGEELWGDSCTFRGLVDLVFPNVDPRRWGFDD